MKHTIDVITMGCSKNLVDSENLLRQFAAIGCDFHHNPETLHGDIAVINTCGFIGDAKEESINAILELAEQKAEGKLRKVYVMGCLSERYRSELKEEIPEVDHFYGKFDWKEMIKDLAPQSNMGEVSCRNIGARVLTTPLHYAYLKISEGCNRSCAYCAIPLITGRHISRPMEDILQEVKELTDNGVHEFQIIAQELTYYGVDLYGVQRLPELIERMAKIPGVKWIRLHYAYPTHFPKELLRVMRENSNVCNYLDIALQHISDHMLTRMKRHITRQETLDLIRDIRNEVPGITLRTTLMVGFPGETEEDFTELLDFVKEAKFDRMGAFTYSEEEGTYAASHYEDNIPKEVKQARLSRLMRLQEQISSEKLAAKIGQVCLVVIDRKEGDYYIGRTESDSPEVDCEVLIKKEDHPIRIGEFYQARIAATEEFDLYANIVNTPSSINFEK